MFSIKQGLLKFKNRLTSFGDQEPVSKMSLTVIILLDIFILSMLFGGLADHTKQLTSPYEYIPYKCRNIIIEKNWSKANQLSDLQQLVLSDYNNYDWRYESTFRDAKINVMHPLCAEFYNTVKSIAEDENIKQLFISRQSLYKKRSQHQKIFNQSKQTYDTSLLKDIAGKSKTEEEITSLSAKMDRNTAIIEDINKKIAKVEVKINANDKVQAVWLLAYKNIEENRKTLIYDLKQFEFWYPIRELGWQLLFMLPIFIIFYLWYSRSIKKQNNIQTLIASHLLVVASWPILLKIIEVVLELIPHRFFKTLFDFLQMMNMIAIWHYLLILGSILVALFIVYIIQKKLFSKEVLYQKRLSKCACLKCGKKLPAGNLNSCPYCGERQIKSCPKCQAPTYIAGKHCINCGDKMEQQ